MSFESEQRQAAASAAALPWFLFMVVATLFLVVGSVWYTYNEANRLQSLELHDRQAAASAALTMPAAPTSPMN